MKTHKSELRYTCSIGAEDPKYYEGLCWCNSMQPPDGAVYLAGVMNEGEIDLWWLDNDPSLAIDELKHYYKDNLSWVDPCIVHVFKQIV